MKVVSDLQKLLDGCKRGDRDCQKLLFDRFYSKMLSVCYRYVSSIEEAKDVTQDCFIVMFGRLDEYNGKGSFEGWLRRIVVNKSIDYYRKKKHKHYSIDEHDWVEIEDESDETDVSIYSNVKPEVIMEQIQKLPPQYRTVFNLYVIEGYSHAEIAEELGVTQGTTKSNLSKARAKLKKELKQYLNYQDV